MKYSPDEHDGCVPESETPEVDEFYRAHPICEYEKTAHPSDCDAWLDFARSLERRLSLAQTEIKWLTVQTTRLGKDLVCAQENFHVTNQAYVKADVERTQAQAEIKGLQAERDLHYTRLAGLLFSGALDKYTGGDVQLWAAEYTKKLTEAQARIAMLEEELRRSKNGPA